MLAGPAIIRRPCVHGAVADASTEGGAGPCPTAAAPGHQWTQPKLGGEDDARLYGPAVRGLGTVVNMATVAGGAAIGVLAGTRLAERFRVTLISGIALITFGVGLSSFLETDNAVFPVVSIILGGLIGEALRLEQRLEGVGEQLRRRFAAGEEGSTFVEGFVTMSLTACVGALTVLGSLADGIRGDSRLLVVKASLDGVVAVVYAASFGWGVAFAALTVGVLQGSITVLGAVLGDGLLTERMVAELSATGGVMIFGIGLRLLDLRQVPVASYLPGLVIAPVLVGLFAR
jgi:uncharacterized membrane protein YqgA involved in biofilm formation